MDSSIFNEGEALTFDDALIVPGYTELLPNQTDISTTLTSKIQLQVPILSAAMDTVTEAPLAIALAREGGLGHYPPTLCHTTGCGNYYVHLPHQRCTNY